MAPPETAALEIDRARVQAVLRATERPYISLKAAATLDGKIASRHGESRWITGEAARAAGRSLRACHAAVLVGIHTALVDDPELTVRDGTSRNPARVVLDSHCRIPASAKLLRSDGAARIVVTGSEAPPGSLRVLEAAGVRIMQCPTPRPRPGDFLPRLRALGLETVLAEGGALVHADLIAHHAADALFLFVAGKVLGDAAAPGWCATLPGGNRLADAPALHLEPPLAIGGDVLVRGHFSRP